ncbi:hypothetical protein ARMGADRAFT_1085512 [Armillaria gallica]|uniref:Peptidase M24 domain-containing protein n=1 Tax=Armillaria gallica TaxID=47427 RepID=A0A2H3D9G7_ARMGA|nr:hypothetical protein ARMGADRAFT_1085512 [Armillaria gallica]
MLGAKHGRGKSDIFCGGKRQIPALRASSSMGPESEIEAPPLQATRKGCKTPSHCSHLGPLPASEFHARVSTLGESLTALSPSSYIVEPNISSSHLPLSERLYCGTCARLLSIPSGVERAEDEAKVQLLDIEGSVDRSIRHFIVDGLRTAFAEATVIAVPTEIRQLRERKSKGELELLKYANEHTNPPIGYPSGHLHTSICISASASPRPDNSLYAALADAGLKDGGCLTLFGDMRLNLMTPAPHLIPPRKCRLPHGSGTDDFALFDCTASLHGYWSDITRTLALPTSTTHLHIWNFVHSAQHIAFRTAYASVVTKRVDEAPRLFLGLAGYAKYFTHRLGHVSARRSMRTHTWT